MFGHIAANALTPRIPQSNGATVVRSHCGHHMHQLGLIGGGHDGHVGQRREEANIERPRMGCAICTDKPCPIDAEPHRQILQRHIVGNLIVPALQKAGIDRAEWFQPAGRHPGRKRHGVLFCDTNIKHPIRIDLLHHIKARPTGHGGSDGNNLGVGFRLRQKTFAEYASVAGGIGC